jgi:F0F1-type ATP synthase membrane subunit b/b'
LNRLEAKVTLLEQEKSRLTEDLNRQAQNIQDQITSKKNLESELQDKKNLVNTYQFDPLSSFFSSLK